MVVLEWVLKQAPQRERGKWLAELRAKGVSKTTPQGKQQQESDEPVLLPQSIWLWEAFSDLSSQRLYHDNGPQAIALSEINSWAELHAINTYDRAFLSYMVVRMDRDWLKAKYAEIKRERELAQQRQERQQLMRRGR